MTSVPKPSASLLDALDDSASSTGLLYFDIDGPPLKYADVWATAGTKAHDLASLAGDGEAVGMLLAPSAHCLSALLGAWQAGLTVFSLPHPSRGASPEGYAELVDELCAHGSVGTLLVSHSEQALCGPVTTRVVTYESLTGGRPLRRSGGPGRLVQYTSGSTSAPKGVDLTLNALHANIDAILDRLSPPPRAAVVSWLPLSHDMGLVGLCLSGLVQLAPGRGDGGEIMLLSPQRFLSNPTSWMTACTRIGAHVTAAPNFAYDIVARRPPTGGDLSSLHACIVGAEPVRADTLRRFSAALAPFGLDPRAICPAYGMAEASLAVSMCKPEEVWWSLRFDREALSAGLVVEDPEGVELVSAGTPLRNMTVKIQGGTDMGELEIEGDSLFTGYFGGQRSSGTHLSGDIGILRRDEIFIVGRTDDRIIVAGRNLYATELELLVSNVDGVRADACAAVPDGTGRYLIIAERRRGKRFRDSSDRICRDVRLALVKSTGTGPSEVILLVPGAFPKTPSGKVQRNRLRFLYESGRLDVGSSVSFRRGGSG